MTTHALLSLSLSLSSVIGAEKTLVTISFDAAGNDELAMGKY